MVLTAFDQNDVVLGLFAGLPTPAPWDLFLHRLLARSAAQRIVLTAGGQTYGATIGGVLDIAQHQAALAAIDRPRLRPGRVYALEELLDFDDPARRARQAALLETARIGDARLIRIDAGEDQSVRIVLLHERTSLSAADGALLTGLAPAVSAAASALAAIAAQRTRLEAAEEALGLLGIGQAVLDRQGQVLTADPLWQRQAPSTVGLAEACTAVANGAARVTMRAGEASASALLVRPLPKGGPGIAVAALRRERLAEPVAAARVIASELGLTPREAALAALLARGHGLVEAGRMLRLTEETARNYSKRIYAKTGARGQADLVRLVLQGLSVLA